jgi:hypothetical protein
LIGHDKNLLKQSKQSLAQTNFKLGFNKLQYMTTNKEIYQQETSLDPKSKEAVAKESIEKKERLLKQRRQ